MSKVFFAGALSLALIGCGKGAPTGPSGTLSQEAAQGLIGSGGAGTTLVSSANVYSDDTQSGFTGVTSRRIYNSARTALGLKPVERLDFAPRNNCSGTPGGDDTDADGDGFPVNLITSFACDILGLTFSGNITVADSDDGVIHSGFTVGINDYRFSGNGAEFLMQGNSTFTRSGKSGTGKLEITAELSGDGGSAEFGYYRDVTVTVNDESDPAGGGGEIGFSGFLVFSVGEFDFTLQCTSESNLTYTAIRAESDRMSAFNGGVINCVDGEGNSLKVTADGSDSGTWTYNGTEITASR